MHLDAGNGGIERGGAQIEQPDGAGADEDVASGNLLGLGAAIEHAVGGDVAARVGRGEAEPQLAVAIGRQNGRADAHMLDAGALPERRHAAASRGAHEYRRFILGDAQRLERQRWIEHSADRQQQGHAAHGLIALGEPVDGAEPTRGLGQHRQAIHGTRKTRHELQRVVAGDRKASMRLRRRFAPGRLPRKADGDRRRGDRGGETLVVGWQLRGLADEWRKLRLVGKQLGEFTGRETVRLRKNEIERDGARSGRRQAIDDLGEPRTRPRPLPDAGERGIVDIDDAHG